MSYYSYGNTHVSGNNVNNMHVSVDNGHVRVISSSNGSAPQVYYYTSPASSQYAYQSSHHQYSYPQYTQYYAPAHDAQPRWRGCLISCSITKRNGRTFTFKFP
jgi:hypothetical protein